ncbi:TIGR04104 family putative zinc finger protein [Virgibacillus salexigens]|uniref:TIGR04104 family putative zinc finger protein n=1 Tax=Virgibacillus massiliensis TaxID=1462526 RepID=UPI00136C9057|nr:TIGR04104 family putative zinc finger protein [Virgibacillus massiliensis]MYL41377.1 hypothetical protein [Virgibacillus massiliensis]
MPICAHCEKQWEYVDTLKRCFRIKMPCPYCGEANYHSAQSRKKEAMNSIIMLPFIFLMNMIFDFSVSGLFIMAGILLMFILAIVPFSIELSEKEEALW